MEKLYISFVLSSEQHARIIFGNLLQVHSILNCGAHVHKHMAT